MFTYKRMNFDPNLLSYTKINIHLNAKANTAQLLEETWVGQYFLGCDTNSTNNKGKTGNMITLKLNFCFVNGIIKEVKGQALEWEKYLKKNLCGNELVSRMKKNNLMQK